jgi:hypothetical protein
MQMEKYRWVIMGRYNPGPYLLSGRQSGSRPLLLHGMAC